MGMIGNQLAPGTQFAVTNDSYNGDGSTTAFTLSQSVSATTDIEVIVDNVQQSPHDGSYSVSGTALTFSGAPSAGTNNIYVIYHGSKHHTTAQVIPDDGSVHSSKIADLAVTHAKLHTDMDLSAKNVNPITMSTGTDKMQMAIQSAVSNRFAIRSTHTADYDNNPFIVYQPSAAGAQNDALVITPEGYITKNKQPAFGVRHQPVTGVDCSSSPYRLFNNQVHTTQVNRGNCFNTSNGTFTAPVSGVYHFGITIRFDGFSGSYAYVTIVPSTGVFTARELSIHTGSYITHTVVGICQLSTNDSVEFQIRNSGDSSINIDPDTNAYGFLIG